MSRHAQLRRQPAAPPPLGERHARRWPQRLAPTTAITSVRLIHLERRPAVADVAVAAISTQKLSLAVLVVSRRRRLRRADYQGPSSQAEQQHKPGPEHHAAPCQVLGMCLLMLLTCARQSVGRPQIVLGTPPWRQARFTNSRTDRPSRL